MAHLKHKWKIVSKAASARLPFYQARGTSSMSQGVRKPHQQRPEPVLCERLGIPASHRPLIPTSPFHKLGEGSHQISGPTRGNREPVGVLGAEVLVRHTWGVYVTGELVGPLTESALLLPVNCSWP